MILHHVASWEWDHHCKRRGHDGQDSHWNQYTANTHISLWHIRHLLRSALPSGLLTASLLVGQENFPLRRSDQIFMHSFWKAQRRTVSGGHQDPEDSLLAFNVFCMGYSNSLLYTRLKLPHSSSSPLTTHLTQLRLHPESCSQLLRQKRQRENSKPVAKAFIHGKSNTYLICIQLQIATCCGGRLCYKVSQEQKI